jgi:putative protein-disulfide isomerase
MQRGLITFLLLIFFLSPTQEKNITGNTVPMKKDKIIYVFDPMCGWCFGFGKVMEEFHAQYKDSFHFDVISGGMVVGEREGPIGDFADYILGAYTKVEEYSGLKFGEAYLDQLKTKKIWSSSVKPAIAIETFKTFNTIDVVDFSHKVQKAYYVDGKDLRDDKVYTDLIKPYAIDANEFISKLNSDEMKKITFDWFKTTSDWGVSGYPTVIQVHKGKYYAIARGYTDLNTLVNNAQSVLVKE